MDPDLAKKALVIVLSDVANDPRVRRQIDWLHSEGWTVDSLGLGEKPTPVMRDHFVISAPPAWTKSFLGLALIHALLPYRTRFHVLSESSIPDEVGRRVRSGEYDLIIFNDLHLLPWMMNKKVFPPSAPVAHIHLDLHEYFPRQLNSRTRGRFLVEGFHRWRRKMIAHPLVSSRTVAAGAAELYEREFKIPRPTLVRNCPPFVDQYPSTVDASRIELVHHGLAAWARGFKEMVDTMKLLDDRFFLTFMLAGSKKVIAELTEYVSGMSDRITIVPPVPMVDLSNEINKYDLEVMFFPPSTKNIEFGLPNKFFEAIQGRLGLVIGPSTMMVDIVKASGNGVIAPGWSVEDLSSTIASLTADRISELKQASHRLAPYVSSENEKENFFRGFGDRFENKHNGH